MYTAFANILLYMQVMSVLRIKRTTYLYIHGRLSALQKKKLIFLSTIVSWKAIKGGRMALSPGLRFPEGFHIQLFPKA